MTGHEVRHASTLGWSDLVNGQLIAAGLAAGFEVMVSTDRSIPYQHSAPPIPIVVIEAMWNTDKDLVAYVPAVLALLNQPLQRKMYVVPRQR